MGHTSLEVFECFPVLETNRFILRKLKQSDAKSIFSYLSREEVIRYYDIDKLTQQQQAVELIESILFRYNIERQLRWGITIKEQNIVIGTCGFHAIEVENFKAEIGYDLHPEYWGKGIMTEVVNKIVEYGFYQMGLNRIEAYYHPLNNASRRVLEKSGFKFEGLLRKRFFKKGEFIDAALSSLIKDEL